MFVFSCPTMAARTAGIEDGDEEITSLLTYV